jgi:hypothetical protein
MRQQASVPSMTYADTILQNHYANMPNGVDINTKLIQSEKLNKILFYLEKGVTARIHLADENTKLNNRNKLEKYNKYIQNI